MATPAERVAADPELRRVLAAARSWGVRPSVFMGASVRTVHEYDGGRLACSIEDGWDGEDVELALALADYEANACPGCGHDLNETTDPANEEQYDARIQARCHRCTALAIAQAQVQHKPHPSALLMSAHLKPRETPNADQVPA